MNRIDELTAQIAALPDMAKLREQLGALQTMQIKLSRHAQEYALQRQRTAAITQVPSIKLAAKAVEHLDSVASYAKTLAKSVSADGAITNDTDRSLTQLSERLANGSSQIEKDWRTQVNQRVQRYAPLANAAERTGLPGAQRLAASLKDLAEWSERPPVSAEQARQFVADAEAVPAAIASLGWTGEVGEFVIKASRGAAKLRDLESAEVRAFLAANPAIADMFRVHLG